MNVPTFNSVSSSSSVNVAHNMKELIHIRIRLAMNDERNGWNKNIEQRIVWFNVRRGIVYTHTNTHNLIPTWIMSIEPASTHRQRPSAMWDMHSKLEALSAHHTSHILCTHINFALMKILCSFAVFSKETIESCTIVVAVAVIVVWYEIVKCLMKNWTGHT